MTHQLRLTIAQIPIEETSNEIPALAPLLARAKPPPGTLIAADAMHCQQESARLVTREWGGDCLFAHALKLAASYPTNDVSRRVAAAANTVCQGEILQTQHRFDLDLSSHSMQGEARLASLVVKHRTLDASLDTIAEYLLDAANALKPLPDSPHVRALRALADAMITEMTATGGLMIAGIGLMLLGIKRLPLANYPPGLIIAPPLVACLR